MISLQNSNKDILAKLMATENITVLHKSVPTAYFDIKSRTLVCPILKETISAELYDLFMGHEVSHALNTPLDGWHDKVSSKGTIYKGYLNVIEDVRIEKMIKAKYPGLRKSFYKGYSELANMDFFGTKGKDLQTLNLIDRINLSYKIGSFAQIEFSDDEMVYIDRCETLETFEEVIQLADDLFERQQNETKDELESLTQEQLQDLLDDMQEGDDESSDTDTMSVEIDEESESDSSGEGAEANSEDEGEDSTGSSTEGEESDSDEVSNEKESEEGELNSESTEGAEGKTAQEKLEEEMIKSETDETFRDKEGTLAKEDSYYSDPSYRELTTRIKYENIIVPVKEIQKNFDQEAPYNDKIKTTVKKFTEDNKKIISYMVKEFEMKKAAASYNRSWNSKSGEIDMNKLAFYKLKEDIFNRVQVTPEGKNHGVVMTVDWSGSMSGNVRATIEQATLLSMFCRRLSIPFRLFAFSDSYIREYNENYGISDDDINAYSKRQKAGRLANQEKHFGKVVFPAVDKFDHEGQYTGYEMTDAWDLGNLSLLEIYNEKMSNREFTKAVENWFQLSSHCDSRYRGWNEETDYDDDWNIPSKLWLSGTPLDATLICMRDYLVDFKKEMNLDITSFIVLSDGASHGCFDTRNPYLVDRAINRTFKLEDRGSRATHGLMEWIKETADCRTIGFYISDARGANIGWEASGFCNTKTDEYGPEMDKKKKEFNALSTSFTDGCYDLAIFINAKKLRVDIDKDMIDVPEGATKGVLKRALVKAGTNKMQQRVILNQFVGQMAV